MSYDDYDIPFDDMDDDEFLYRSMNPADPMYMGPKDEDEDEDDEDEDPFDFLDDTDDTDDRWLEDDDMDDYDIDYLFDPSYSNRTDQCSAIPGGQPTSKFSGLLPTAAGAIAANSLLTQKGTNSTSPQQNQSKSATHKTYRTRILQFAFILFLLLIIALIAISI